MFFTYSKKAVDSFIWYLRERVSKLSDRVSKLEQQDLINTTILVKLDEYGVMPTKAHTNDLYCPMDISRSDVIQAWYEKKNLSINTGVHIDIPKGFVGLILPRSSLALKGVPALTGVIDAGYQGELKITYPLPDLFTHINAKTHNRDTEIPSKHMRIADTMVFNKGDRIAQIVILPLSRISLAQTSEFEQESERGSFGFGSSGK